MVSHNHTKYLYFLKLEMSVLHSALIKQATTLSEAGMTQIIILWKQTVIIKNRVEKKKTSLIRIHPFSCPDSQLPSGLLAEAFFFFVSVRRQVPRAELTRSNRGSTLENLQTDPSLSYAFLIVFQARKTRQQQRKKTTASLISCSLFAAKNKNKPSPPLAVSFIDFWS